MLSSWRESSSSKSLLLTDSRSQVEAKIWFSNVAGSKLIFSLNEKEVESSYNSKDDEVNNEMSQFSDDVEESFLILSEEGSSEVLEKGDLR